MGGGPLFGKNSQKIPFFKIMPPLRKNTSEDLFFFQVSLNFGWKKLGKTLKILKNTENLGKYSEKYKW